MSGVRPRFLIWLLVTAVTLVLSGWGSTDRFSHAWDIRTSSFEPALSAVNTIAPEAILLNTVPLDTFTFARLGTNDDQGFLRDAPSRAHLGCSTFHLYDFSPDADFMNAAECMKSVDVILLTDNFVVFGNGAKAGVVRPILDYVNYAFTCIRVDTNQLCKRKPGIY